MRQLVPTATAPEVHYHAVPPPSSVQHGVTGSLDCSKWEILEAPQPPARGAAGLGPSLWGPQKQHPGAVLPEVLPRDMHGASSSSSSSTASGPLVPPGSVYPPATFENQDASQYFEEVDPFDQLQASMFDREAQTQPEEPSIPLNRSDIVQALIMAAKE